MSYGLTSSESLVPLHKVFGADVKPLRDLGYRGQTGLDAVGLYPDDLARRESDELGEIFLRHESSKTLLFKVPADFHGGHYSHTASPLTFTRHLPEYHRVGKVSIDSLTRDLIKSVKRRIIREVQATNERGRKA